MTRFIANVLIGLHPREWRARYGDEFRALMDDRSPSLSDLPGIASSAARAWTRAAEDALERPALWSMMVLVRGLSRDAVILAAATVATWLLSRALSAIAGPAPAWLGHASGLAAMALAARAFVSSAIWAQIPLSIRLRPFSTRGFAVFSGLALTVCTAAAWAGKDTAVSASVLGSLVWIHLLFDCTPAGWARARALLELSQLRGQWRDEVVRRRHLVPMLASREVTHEEVARNFTKISSLRERAVAAAALASTLSLFRVPKA